MGLAFNRKRITQLRSVTCHIGSDSISCHPTQVNASRLNPIFSRYCADYSGFGCQNAFRSGWQCWCIAASTALHLATWPQIFSASHLNARRRLRSSTTSAVVAPRTVRSTIGDRTFPATAASVWNSLPESVRSSPSLQVFCSRLKTELFARSYRHD